MKPIEGGMGNGSGHLGRSRDLAKSEKWLDKYFPTAPLILPSSADDLKWIFDLEKRTTMTKPWSLINSIHSKSESRDPNDPAKKLELSANLSKNATKWPQMTLIGPKITQNNSKWPKNDARIDALFPQFFFDWKGGSANFFAFRMYVCK